MIDTPNCQGQLTNGKINVYPQLDSQSIHEFHDFAITMNAEKYCELKESKRQGSDIERESRKRYRKK